MILDTKAVEAGSRIATNKKHRFRFILLGLNLHSNYMLKTLISINCCLLLYEKFRGLLSNLIPPLIAATKRRKSFTRL